MNPTTLFDETLGSTANIDITSSPRYENFPHLVDMVRRALQDNANVRRPFVELLCSLYEKRSGTIRKIKSIRLVRPTDEDVLQHFQAHFPSVVLTEPLPSDDGSFTWGFTLVGIEQVNDEKIYFNGNLVEFWLSRSQVFFCQPPNRGMSLTTPTIRESTKRKRT